MDQIFKILDEEDISEKPVIPCLANLSKKSETDIPNIVSKFKNHLKITPNDLEKLHPVFSEEGKEEVPTGVWVFCQNLGITVYVLENYSNFKRNFHLTMTLQQYS